MKFRAKEWFIFIISMLLLTDIIIFLNIPIIRQVLAFLCFTIIPGLLILHILKLNKIDFFKKLVLSVGLSIAFLMFVGLLLNQLYLAVGISEPLSTSSLVISFTFILIILGLVAYRRNKDDLDIPNFLSVKSNHKKDQFISPLFFPMIFPFLAVFGTYLMNTERNNILLMVLFFLIPAYVVIVVYLRNRIPKITYPVAILAIAAALLLMQGLTSRYICGQDIQLEYQAFQIVGYYQYWSISNHHNMVTGCLSTSLLPSIYWSLLDINKPYVYKAVYQVLCAITPLVCYILYKKYADEVYAFLASVFFMSQMSFMFGLLNAMRTQLAILFFALAMMCFFDDEIDKLSKRILFLIFVFSTIVSHYTTCYIFFFMILAFWLVTVLMGKNFKSDPHDRSTYTADEKIDFSVPKYVISATMVILFFTVIFFWYSQLTVGFTSFARYIESTVINMANFFEEEMRAQVLVTSLSGEVNVLPDKISVVVHWITFIFMFIGVFDLMREFKNKKLNFEFEYPLMMAISGVILASMIILPYVSLHYGGNRLYQQSLVLLAFAFVAGGTAICRYIHRPKFSLIIILIILISQFFCATYIVHQVSDVPYSFVLNREGLYSKYYIYDQEVIAAKWLNDHDPTTSGYEENRPPFVSPKHGGYIFLGHAQVIEKYTSDETIAGRCKIYDNKCSEIYK